MAKKEKIREEKWSLLSVWQISFMICMCAVKRRTLAVRVQSLWIMKFSAETLMVSFRLCKQ